MLKKALHIACTVALSAVSAGTWAADKYPRQPVKLVVPAAVGGSTDTGARLVGELLGKELNTSIVVENKGGGGGRIGASSVKNARPDGYTLLYGNNITHALLPALAEKIDYDPLEDFVPIGQVFRYATLIVCHKSTPYDTLAEFIDYAKAHPKQVTIATAGIGSGNHFSAELLNSMAGIETTQVPYRGNQPAVQDILGGFAHCIHMTEAKAFIDSGDFKVLATTGHERDPRYPDVPTVNELGLPGYDMTWWQTIFAPKGTPPEVLKQLSDALSKVAANDELRKKTFDAGFVPEYKAPEAVIKAIKNDMSVFTDIAKKANITID